MYVKYSFIHLSLNLFISSWHLPPCFPVFPPLSFPLPLLLSFCLDPLQCSLPWKIWACQQNIIIKLFQRSFNIGAQKTNYAKVFRGSGSKAIYVSEMNWVTKHLQRKWTISCLIVTGSVSPSTTSVLFHSAPPYVSR